MVSQERVGFYPAGHPSPETRQPCTRLISSPLTRRFSGELLSFAALGFR